MGALNEVFPEICSAPLGEVPAGSLALIPNHDGPLMALVTEQSVQKDLRSIVILNLTLPNTSSIVFHDNWGTRDSCVYYKSALRFELSNKIDDVSTNATWWRTPGIIASLQREFFIRASTVHGGGFRYVNVKTGAVFAGDTPNFYSIFGVWSIWLRDPLRERSTQLFDFNIHNQGSKQT
jgi:hypothetical protein